MPFTAFHTRCNLLLLALFSASALFAQSAKKITLVNPSAIARQDELVVLQRAILKQKSGHDLKFVSVTGNGKKPTVQQDDLDGDGQWDEAVFLYSFEPNEKVTLNIVSTNAPDTIGLVQRAHVRLRKKITENSFGPYIIKEEMPAGNPPTDFSKTALPNYLTEGPAWENDKVAFRLYLDVRNNKDIYGKTTSRMMMDTVGANTKVSYHNLSDWGMDVLHVVKSLGAGALALSIPQPSGNDTLIRLGGQDVKRTIYQQMADGPVRAIFKMSYEWGVLGMPVQITEQISIWGGQYFYESKVTVNGAPANSKLVTGMAAFYHNLSQSFASAKSNILLSHGRQSENHDYMGMAIMVPSTSFAYSGTTPNEQSEILNTFISAQNINPGKPGIYRYYVAWEKTDQQFASLNYFKNLLQREAQKFSRPIKVTW